MKNRIARLFPLVLSLLILTSACASPAPAEPTVSPLSASLSELRGSVSTKQAQEQDFSPAKAGQTVGGNGQVKTGADGHARLDLSSGTIVRVVPDSLYTLVSNEQGSDGLKTKFKLDLGRIFIILKGGSADVETPSGVASVRGSFMMVEVDPKTKDVLVTCLEGHCSANNPAGSVDLTGGQKTVLFAFDPATGKYRPPKAENMSDEDFQKWLDENPEAQQVYLAAIATLTAMAPATEPPATEPPTATPTATTAPVAACFKLIKPNSDTQLALTGPVTFAWETQTGAATYQVTFTYPNGFQDTIVTSATELVRYMESIPGGGKYSWEVTAFNSDNSAICTATAFGFSKLNLATDLVPTKEKPPKVVCTYLNAQWNNPGAPCYCDPNNSSNWPPYCMAY